MSKRKLRNRLTAVISLGAAVAAATMILGSGVAFAAGVPSDPPGGATPVYPNFYNGNVESIRGAGSDTTLFMMQTIGDLYESAGLYGCTLDSATGQALYNSNDSDGATSQLEYYCDSGANTNTTDTSDNWDRTEVSEGVDDIGSGAGQEQLCGNLSSPLPIDFARSSKSIISTSSGGCSDEVETGYAKDGVPAVDFPTLNPSTYGTSSNSTSGYDTINGGSVGPVADGWLPGDSVSGPYTGSELSNIANNDNGGGTDTTAYRLWCAIGGTGTGTSAQNTTGQITDWGQLTNLGSSTGGKPGNLVVVDASMSGTSLTAAPKGTVDGYFTGSSPDVLFPSSTYIANGASVTGGGAPSGTTVSGGQGTTTLTLNNSFTPSGPLDIHLSSALSEGQGLPVGIPVRIVAVNTASGIEYTFSQFAESGVSGGGCASNLDTNGASDPNATEPNTAHTPIANNAAQLALYAQGDFPSDSVDQAIELATSLYFESNGVYNTDPYAGETTVGSTTYTGNKIEENGEGPTEPNLLNNIYPTASTLYNIYLNDKVRASTAGFLNWICQTNGDNSGITKGTDERTGVNYDSELNTIITGEYGFTPRLTDESESPSVTTPADNLEAPNTDCASGVTSGAGNGDPPITSVPSGTPSQT